MIHSVFRRFCLGYFPRVSPCAWEITGATRSRLHTAQTVSTRRLFRASLPKIVPPTERMCLPVCSSRGANGSFVKRARLCISQRVRLADSRHVVFLTAKNRNAVHVLVILNNVRRRVRVSCCLSVELTCKIADKSCQEKVFM